MIYHRSFFTCIYYFFIKDNNRVKWCLYAVKINKYYLLLVERKRYSCRPYCPLFVNERQYGEVPFGKFIVIIFRNF